MQTSSQAIVERGGSGRIPCSYQWPVESVTWSRGDSYDQRTDIVTLNLTYGKATSGWGYDEGRFSVADDFSLLIEDIVVEDEGMYFCTVTDSAVDTPRYNDTDVSVIGTFVSEY